jgi:S1-C subfamily serine protease
MRPYLGIAMQEVQLPQKWRSSADPEQEHGLLVMHVAPDAPARQAGITLGDVIISADARPVEDARQLHQPLMQKHTGEALKLRVLRGGNAMEAQVMLGDRLRP